MKVFIIGDTHYGHRNICKYRPMFSSVEEHDTTLHEAIMSVAHKRNVLWLIGDNFFEPYTLKFARDYHRHFQAVNWVIGNHDTDKPYRVELLKQMIKEDLFDKVGSLFKITGKAWISHHPMHPDELWGKINIHGHVHTNTIADERYVNVSADNLLNWKPANLQDLYDIEKRKFAIKNLK